MEEACALVGTAALGMYIFHEALSLEALRDQFVPDGGAATRGRRTAAANSTRRHLH